MNAHFGEKQGLEDQHVNQGCLFVPAIGFSSKDYGQDAAEDLSPTLRAGTHQDSHANGGCAPAVAYAIQERAVCENPLAGPDGAGFRDDDVAYTMEARQTPQAVLYALQDGSGGGSGQNGVGVSDEDTSYTLDTSGHQSVAICVTGEITRTLKAEGFDASEDGTGRGQPIITTIEAYRVPGNVTPYSTGDRVDALTSANDSSAQFPILQNMAVRRLMPVECERLMGFPDNYTLVPTGPKRKPAADGPRYKQLGNSWAVTCVRWIGRRIAAHLAMIETDEFATLLEDEFDALLAA